MNRDERDYNEFGNIYENPELLGEEGGVAIWVLDFCYYNPLLTGAAEALFKIEEESKSKMRIQHIEMSLKIRDAVAGQLPREAKAWKLVRGRWLFYILVFLALASGFTYSIIQYVKQG